MIKLVFAVVALLGTTIAVVLVAGALAPVRHVAKVSLVLGRSASEVWAVVSELQSWPSWNTAVTKMERLPARDGNERWMQGWSGDSIPIEVLEQRAPSDSEPGRLVTRIDDDALPFGGSWTWTLEPHGAGTKVTITEDGLIKSAFFRGMSRLFLGYTGSQSKALGSLAKKLDQPATLEQSVTFPSR